MAEISKLVDAAFTTQRAFLIAAALSQKPSDSDFAKVPWKVLSRIGSWPTEDLREALVLLSSHLINSLLIVLAEVRVACLCMSGSLYSRRTASPQTLKPCVIEVKDSLFKH